MANVSTPGVALAGWPTIVAAAIANARTTERKNDGNPVIVASHALSRMYARPKFLMAVLRLALDWVDVAVSTVSVIARGVMCPRMRTATSAMASCFGNVADDGHQYRA